MKLKSTKCRVSVLQLRGGGCSGSKGAAAADVQTIVPSSEDAAGEKTVAEANVAEETVEEEAAKAKMVETEKLEELVVPAGVERQHHPYCLLPRRALSCPL